MIEVITIVTSETEGLARKGHEDMFWYGRNYASIRVVVSSLSLTPIIHTFVYVNQNNF